MRYDYLIIGGGMTAEAAAAGIRELDPNGTIGLIGEERHPPYNRPPLTKALWKGDPLESIWRRMEPHRVTLHLGRRAKTLTPLTSTVTDDQGTRYTYGKLLLATGGSPRRLVGAPDETTYYRTLDDYHRVRAQVDARDRFIVIGGGFIGAEIAAAIRMQGREVTMIVPGTGLGGRVFPEQLSRFLAGYYREKGVAVRTGDSAEKIEKRDGQFVVTCKSGVVLQATQVIAGLGITPNVELAKAAGLTVSDGIEVNRQLRTSDSAIYAAGDVANFMNVALGKRTRVEHEDNANTMGRVAGRIMAGSPESYDHLPFFYSDLFDLGYEAVGDLDARHETVVDWKEEFKEGVIYYLEQGRVRGVLLWNTWNQVDHARALIAEPGPFTAAELQGRLPA
ncbi:MAG TPA: FAD-dependent oxidoreductase [Gemmatimonadales bacterium]|nr:FAD-dependent oxidoreductase [Gemmatimonadales bacterium]